MNFGKRYISRMKKQINRLKQNKKDMFDLDQLLESNNLSYSGISFSSDDSDILKSYQNINKKLNTNNRFIQNLRTVIPYINFKPILKPAYTVILTTIIIFAIIEYRTFTKPVQYAEITVEQGEKVTLHINDQFTVYLNSGSTIKVPMHLKRSSEIQFEGEAYFNMNQDKNVTIVSKGIRFSGKKANFTINTHNSDQLVAHVEIGDVSLYNPVLPKSTKLILKNGDKATFTPYANLITVEQQKNKNYLAWHTGVIVFDKTPLYSAINDLSKHFEIPMQIENRKLSTQKITAHYTNLEIDHILDKVQSQLNCQISADGSKIIIH